MGMAGMRLAVWMGLALSAGCATAPDRICLLASPRDVRDDKVYPPGATHQRMEWRDGVCRWQINWPADRHAWVDVVRQGPLDLRSGGRLVFRLQPAGAASNLRIALLDAANPPHCVESPLPAATGSGPAVVQLPLTAFQPASVEDEAFDRSAVRGLRLVRDGGPAADTTISDIEIRP